MGITDTVNQEFGRELQKGPVGVMGYSPRLDLAKTEKESKKGMRDSISELWNPQLICDPIKYLRLRWEKNRDRTSAVVNEHPVGHRDNVKCSIQKER